MKLLFDQNLSRKLVTRLADVFPDVSHVQFHALADKTDTEIWEFAKLNDFCIVTQDAGFAERSRFVWLSAKGHMVKVWKYTDSSSRNSHSCRTGSNSSTSRKANSSLPRTALISSWRSAFVVSNTL